MKLNADVGEEAGHDEMLFRWIDLANVACGAHAGGLDEMKRAVDLALTYGVKVGAHPGYPDPEHFGRKSIAMPAGEIERMITIQVQTLNAVCIEAGLTVEYVKPHGALYHDMMSQLPVFEEIVRSVSHFLGDLPLMIMARGDNEQHVMLAKKWGVPLLYEAFADRAYTDAGDLMDRSQPGAVFDCADQMLAQAKQIAEKGSVTTAGGNTLVLRADTLCVHGDNEASSRAMQVIYESLRS